MTVERAVGEQQLAVTKPLELQLEFEGSGWGGINWSGVDPPLSGWGGGG